MVFFVMDHIITALEPQKNNPDRINVYIDREFAFGISRFVGAWLKKGEQLDEARIQSLMASDLKEKALQKALHFIAYQPRSEMEIRDKLAKAGFEGAVIDGVMADLKEKGYLNDARFAQEWVESRTASKPRSRRFYAYELKHKGIPEATVSQAIENAPEDSELAFALGNKYLNRFAKLEDMEFRKKMQGVLARRAFSYDIIKETINQLILIRNMEGIGREKDE
jgi:regulatory protein